MRILTTTFVSYRKLITNYTFSRCICMSTAIQTTPSFQELPISLKNPKLSQQFVQIDATGVMEVLNILKKQPNDALVFFRFVNNHGFLHNTQCYATIIRILCGSGLEKRLGSLLKDVISSKEKHPHFEVESVFKVLAESFDSGGEEDERGIPTNRMNPMNRVLGVLVKTYAELEMFDDAIDVLFRTGRWGFVDCVRSCNFIINCLIECGKTDMALVLFQQLKHRVGLSPDVYTYTILIKAHCRRGNLAEAIDVFKELEEAGIADAYARTTFVDGLCASGNSSVGHELLQAWRGAEFVVHAAGYNAVIRGFCNEMRLEDAEKVLEDMREHGVGRDECSYSSLIRGYCQAGNIVRAFSLHKDMVADGIKSNYFIASAILQCLCKMGLTAEVVDYFQWFKDSGMFLDEIAYNIVIDAFCKLGEMHEAESLLDEMKERRMVPDVIHYTCLINGYCRQDELESALAILQEMKEIGVNPDIITFNILVGDMYRLGYAQEAVDLLSYMEAQGLKPNDDTYCAIIKGLCRGGKLKEAREVLNALEGKPMLACSAMVTGYCETDHTVEAYGLFISLLSTHGVLVSKKACFHLLDNLCKEGDLERALVAFGKMLDLGVSLDEIVYCKLIAALCRHGNMKTARRVFDNLIDSGVTPDIISYTTMMNGYCKANCVQEASDLFNDMKEKGIKPDVITYTVLIDGHQKVNNKSRSNTKRKVSQESPSSEGTKGNSCAPAALKSEMNIMDTKPDVVYYTVLIDGQCKTNNLQDAVNLFDEMVDMGLTPDAVTYTALVSGYCSQGGVDSAIYLVDDMVSKGITPNTRTISTLMNGFEILEARKVKFRHQ